MDRARSLVTLEVAPDAPAELRAAAVAAGRCLDAWHGFVGAVVSRPVTVPVVVGEPAEGLSIAVPESLLGDPGLAHALLLAALEAVDEAGRRWPPGKPRRLWRGKAPADPVGPGEMLLLAHPDDGDTIDDYLEERLATPGIAEAAHRDVLDGVPVWVLAPL